MSQQSVLDPHGPAAAQINVMNWIMMAGAALIALAVFSALARAARRRPDDTSGNEETALRWVILAGAAAPAVIIVALFLYAVALFATLAPTRHKPALTIELTGKQWWWHVRYLDPQVHRTVTSANEIHIPAGQPVHIRLRSTDVIHSFWVPELQGKIDMIPGRTNLIWLQADRPGVYRGQCAEYCGLQHAHMALFVVAHEPAEFRQWLEAEGAAARPEQRTAAGRAVFMNHGCAVCHTIRGTEARGTIGPDLTHVGSRRSLAAGTLTNTRGALGGWIIDPQVIKPGNHMPRVPLESTQLTALLDYLESLR